MPAEPLRLGQPRLRLPWANHIAAASPGLLGLPCLVPEGGDWQHPAPAATVQVERPGWVLLAVHEVGPWQTPAEWQELPHGLVWRFAGSARYRADRILARFCPAGPLALPAPSQQRHVRGFYARPHLVLLAEDLPAAPGQGEDREALLAEAHRVEAFTLQAGDLAATVQTRPDLRLTAFTRDGGPALLAPAGQDPCGVRTWFMAPAQDRESPLIACLPARVLERQADRCRLTTGCEPVTGLELLWEVRLDPAGGRLLLRHGLRSHRPAPLRLAVWSLIAGSAPGAMRSLLLRDAAEPRPALRVNPPGRTPFSVQPGPWPGTGAHDLPEAVLLEAATPAGAPTIKLGLRSPSGLAALLHADGLLLSRVRADAAGPYPEGDLNLTTYRSADIIEIEHVGPLVDLAPGATTWLEQELRHLDPAGTDRDDLPELAARIRAAWA